MKSYRAKEIEHNQWVYGSYFNHIKRTLCPMGDCLKKEDCQPLIIQDGFSDWNMPRGIVGIDVDPNTICKNTSIIDINHKEVFTKDIVKVKSSSTGKEKLYYIDFDKTRFHFGFCEINHGYCFSLEELLEKEIGDELSIEIIGNTIDTPELLRNKTNYNKCKNCKYISIPFNSLSVCNLQQQAIEDINTCEQWEDKE